MILLRALCIIFAGLLLLLAPSFATEVISEVRGESVQASVPVMATAMSGVFLMVAGFFFVGIAGHRMARRLWMRLLAGLLLVFPFAGAGVALLYSEHPAIVWISGPVVCFTVIAFTVFVFPGVRRGSRRPMRPRDYADSEAPVEFVTSRR